MRRVAILSLVVCAEASYERIASYSPDSMVTDHNAIDLDQDALELALSKTPVDYLTAMSIYTQGGNSKPYSVLTVPAVPSAIDEDTVVIATGEDGSTVSGTVYESVPAGGTTISVLYDISEIQEMYVRCRVGGLPAELQMRDGCVNISSPVTIGSNSVIATAAEHRNDRTIQGFSTGAKEKMFECDNGCPYPEYVSFYDYYGSHNYADDWVKGALTGTKVDYPTNRGSADFSTYSDDLTRVEAAKKGTAYMNVWMYVVREFEDAIGDCKADCIKCNDDPVHAWDEGVAFYTGSLVEPQTTSGDATLPLYTGGKLLWTLMDKRCMDFKTCGHKGDATTGTAKVNRDLSTQFNIGQLSLLLGQCEEASVVKDRVVDLMRIGLIQGTIRYAYKVDKLAGDAKEKAEGAVFAASVLPALHACNNDAANTVYENMKLGASSTSFVDVKRAFEDNYGCLGITCADVGGLWFDGAGDYYEGAGPCHDPSTGALNGGAIAGIVIAACVALFFLCLLLCVIRRERKGKPLFMNLERPKVSEQAI